MQQQRGRRKVAAPERWFPGYTNQNFLQFLLPFLKIFEHSNSSILQGEREGEENEYDYRDHQGEGERGGGVNRPRAVMILVTSSTLMMLSSSEKELERRIKRPPSLLTPDGPID
jgi:hypothetical protein